MLFIEITVQDSGPLHLHQNKFSRLKIVFIGYTPNSPIRQVIYKKFMLPKYEKFRKKYFAKFDATELAFIKEHFYKDL